MCKPAPKFVIYLDDDTVIDIRSILLKLKTEEPQVTGPTIFGSRKVLFDLERAPCSKWFVPLEYFPPIESKFPNGLEYVYGHFVILVNGAHEKLLEAAKKTPNFVWPEDVTWYGIVRNMTEEVKIIPWNQHSYEVGYNLFRTQQLDFVRMASSKYSSELIGKRQFLFSHVAFPHFAEVVWNSFEKRHT